MGSSRLRRLRPLLLFVGALLAASAASCFVSALAPGLQGALAARQRSGGRPMLQVAATENDNEDGSKEASGPFKGGLPADTIFAIVAAIGVVVFVLGFIGQ
mmetsp:Transcript_97334/g.208845  ORF Transcript_97334/g.208845 Transcript_97334/m.208845 type:complete len:101 (-) Transcript_97334:156-458(-)